MDTDRNELEKLDSLYAGIRNVLEKARSTACQAVNLAMVQAYWQIGYLIVEHEQEGKKRAEYGKAVLEEVSQRLTSEFGRGFDVTNLRKMRQFYLMFSKRDAAGLKSGTTKRDAMRLESESYMKASAVRTELSWTHYRLLLRVENDRAREWYMNEAIVRYSVLKESRQLFASKYMLYLPTEEELGRELERERKLIEKAQSEESSE